MTTHHHPTTTCLNCQTKDEKIRRLSWNPLLQMYRAPGLEDAITSLPTNTTYSVIVCDIDKMKAINSATGNHFQTDRYLAAGLKVRDGEIAGQLHDKGDEFCFILNESSRHEDSNPDAFVARISRQLAGQPLTISERYYLAAAQGCHVSQARLSATFAVRGGVAADDILDAIEQCSSEVLLMKARRDGQR